ncbi:MAG: YncE family protein [Stenotrophomonas sp.]
MRIGRTCTIPFRSRAMSHIVSMPRIVVFSISLIASLAAAANEASPELTTGTRVAVRAGPADMVFSADGQQLYVTENEDNTVAVIDVGRRSVLRRFGEGGWKAPEGDGCSHNFCRGSGAVGIAIDTKRQQAYVSSWNINALTAFDLRSGQALWSTALQRFPQPLLLTPDGAQAWVFNGVANSLSVVDAVNGEMVADTIPLEGGDARNLSFGRQLALAMAADGRHVYVNSVFGDGIEVFDTTTRSRSGQIQSGASPYDLAVDRSTGNLVALYEDGVEHRLEWRWALAGADFSKKCGGDGSGT